MARDRLITALNLLEAGLPLRDWACCTAVDPAYFAVDLPPR